MSSVAVRRERVAAVLVFIHGDICARLSAALVAFNEVHKLGVVLDSSTGFWMSNRNCRAPDVSFVSSGTQLAWVIHPEEQFVEICHSPTERRILGPGAVLEGEQVLPSFQYPIASLFSVEEWD